MYADDEDQETQGNEFYADDERQLRRLARVARARNKAAEKARRRLSLKESRKKRRRLCKEHKEAVRRMVTIRKRDHERIEYQDLLQSDIPITLIPLDVDLDFDPDRDMIGTFV